MTPEQAEACYNILVFTKVWSHKEYPLQEVGKIVQNFAEIEEVTFSPSYLAPGIEPSANP